MLLSVNWEFKNKYRWVDRCPFGKNSIGNLKKIRKNIKQFEKEKNELQKYNKLEKEERKRNKLIQTLDRSCPNQLRKSLRNSTKTLLRNSKQKLTRSCSKTMRNTAKFIGWRSPTLRNKNGLQTFRDKLLTINNKIIKEKEKELYILTQNVNNNNINYNNNSRDSCMVNQKMSISPKLYGPLFKDKTLQKRHVINIHGLQRHDIELYLICLILSFYHSISYNNNNTLINPLTYIDSLKKINSETYSYIYLSLIHI